MTLPRVTLPPMTRFEKELKEIREAEELLDRQVIIPLGTSFEERIEAAALIERARAKRMAASFQRYEEAWSKVLDRQRTPPPCQRVRWRVSGPWPPPATSAPRPLPPAATPETPAPGAFCDPAPDAGRDPL